MFRCLDLAMSQSDESNAVREIVADSTLVLNWSGGGHSGVSVVFIDDSGEIDLRVVVPFRWSSSKSKKSQFKTNNPTPH